MRLERELLPCFVQELNPFQFHKGAIRTYYLNYVDAKTSEFQFHKGAIRTPKEGATDYALIISIP